MNDTADTSQIAVIATRLPYIDRRSLSEAWLSALHVMCAAPPSRPKPDRRLGVIGSACAKAPLRASRAGTDVRAAVTLRPPALPGSRLSFAAGETDPPHRPAALPGSANAAYQRARSYPPFRTSLSVGLDGERVRLLLRREGATLHVVALCRPEIAALVRRALAAADAHLRLRGESVLLSVCAEAECVKST